MKRLLAAVLFVPIAVLIGTFWWWQGLPVPMPPQVAAEALKLPCVSYAPFRRGETPFNESYVATPQAIEEDLINLKAITSCVRTYSVGQGLDRVPDLAAKHGMTVLMGIWLGRDPEANAKEIALGIETARKNPNNIRAVVVGNEVLLRRELSADTLGAIIHSVKLQVPTPVTYADVWEFWLQNRSLAEAVDFLTIHILPYWEDDPVGASEAASHVIAIREEVGEIFAGKEILIGETGWPSWGRMREAAFPSPSNQARVVQEILTQAHDKGFDVNLIEAFDQPWKRILEGTVGGHWGILDVDSRAPKFGLGAPVSDHSRWLYQAIAGIIFAGVVMAVAQQAAQRATWPIGTKDWLAAAAVALVSGCAVGALAESAFYEVQNVVTAVTAALLATVTVALSLFTVSLRMRTIPPRPLGDLGDPRDGQRTARWFGITLGAGAFVGMFTVLGLVFDPRYRDFPIAAFVAIALAALVAPRRGGTGASTRAEHIFGWIIGLGALAIIAREGVQNVQALLLVAALIVLARSLVLGGGGRTSAARG
ncbi:beta-1,6-glucan synthase [Agaricicola taiwanensis]|uniref:Endo-1,3-beta-glucanase btgC n=1 Tax=Agaricicola taiwanensis TaxID=591372 RepID=A0A8J2YIC8_9RHOB|nr:glycosyl hydrolase family 17 protein [Agaricicola taiwanensis]GGE44961.1 beta-1,6-glucan synthase [Agaricicola taiwanensis]